MPHMSLLRFLDSSNETVPFPETRRSGPTSLGRSLLRGDGLNTPGEGAFSIPAPLTDHRTLYSRNFLLWHPTHSEELVAEPVKGRTRIQQLEVWDPHDGYMTIFT